MRPLLAVGLWSNAVQIFLLPEASVHYTVHLQVGRACKTTGQDTSLCAEPAMLV